MRTYPLSMLKTTPYKLHKTGRLLKLQYFFKGFKCVWEHAMWCQLFYVIPGAVLCSKFHDSNVMSMKLALLNHFHFSFLSRKSSEMENIQSKCVRLHQVWTTLPVYTPVSAFVMTPLSFYLCTYAPKLSYAKVWE